MAGKVNMKGVWLVHYGIEGRLEGNMVMTIADEPIDKDMLLAGLQKSIYDSMPDNAKACVDADKDLTIVIRNMIHLGAEI